MTIEQKKYTYDEWNAEGEKRFGKDKMKWKFVCPICKHVQSAEDYKKAGATADAIGFSCVGRWLPTSREAFGTKKDGKKPGPCNYAGGGFFKLNPLEIALPDGSTERFFEFAEADPVPVAQETPK